MASAKLKFPPTSSHDEASTAGSAPVDGIASGDRFTIDRLTNLKGRTVSNGIVTISSQGIQFLLSLVSVMIMARLLSKEDFGLVAMVLTVAGVLRIFNDSGLSTATIQREGITQAQVSNLFWTNVAVGGLISLALAMSSPIIAWFYHEPRLVAITLVLSSTFLITTSSVQHMALLKRKMRFKAIALIEVSAALSGAIVGVGMAWMNFGYWAPVGMQLATPSVTLVLTWLVSDWRPHRPSRNSGTRSLLGFGAHLTASSFLWSIAKGSDGLLIGRFYGPGALGLYTRAGALLSRPMDQLVGPIAAVLVPTLSRLQSQPERYRRVLLQVYEATAVTSFLFTGLLFAVSRPLVLVMLGPKWEEAAPIFAGFTLVALFIPVGSVAGWLLTSQGRGKDIFLQSVIASVLTVVSCLAGLSYGPVGVATSYSAFCLFVALPINYAISGRKGPVSARDLWLRFLRNLPVWIVVCGATWFSRQLVIGAAPFKQLVVCGTVGFLSGIAFVFIYPPSRRAAVDMVNAVSELKKPRSA